MLRFEPSSWPNFWPCMGVSVVRWTQSWLGGKLSPWPKLWQRPELESIFISESHSLSADEETRLREVEYLAQGHTESWWRTRTRAPIYIFVLGHVKMAFEPLQLRNTDLDSEEKAIFKTYRKKVPGLSWWEVWVNHLFQVSLSTCVRG